MTRKEKIEDLKKQIFSKMEEISELKNQINSEKISDFYERHNFVEGQHFLYDEKECVGVEYDGYSYKTHRVKKDGELSIMSVYIYNEDKIKPI